MDKANRLAAAEKSTATRRAYAADFAIFSSWCSERDVKPLPAEPAIISAFLAFEVGRGRRPSTLGRRLAAIQFWHLTAGHEPPTTAEPVRATLRGIRRVFGTARRRKAPAIADLAKAMARSTPPTLVGLRDRALILLGFAGALRRSELVALDVSDLVRTEKGAPGDNPPVQNGSRGGRRHDCDSSWGSGLPCQSIGDLAIGSVGYRGPGFPADRQVGQGFASSSVRPCGHDDDQTLRQANGIGCKSLLCTFSQIRVLDLGSRKWRFHFQDDGCLAT